MQYGTVNLVVQRPEGGVRPYGLVGMGVYYRPIKVTTPGVGWVPGYCDPWWYVCYPGGWVETENIIGERSSTDFGMDFGGGVNFGVILRRDPLSLHLGTGSGTAHPVTADCGCGHGYAKSQRPVPADNLRHSLLITAASLTAVSSPRAAGLRPAWLEHSLQPAGRERLRRRQLSNLQLPTPEGATIERAWMESRTRQLIRIGLSRANGETGALRVGATRVGRFGPPASGSPSGPAEVRPGPRPQWRPLRHRQIIPPVSLLP